MTVRVMATMSTSASAKLAFPGDRVTLAELLQVFLHACPVRSGIRDGDGLRRDVRVFVGDRLVRHAEASDVAVPDGAEVWLIPGTAGG